ncbi:MAG: thioredoxin 1 [Methanobacteriota archaeon]|jgi:thioredoxin 1
MSQKAEKPENADTPREFKDAVDDGRVLVDFYADWCAPCRTMEPAVEEVADEGVRVVKVDIDENQKTASAYGVRSVPTLIVFEDGEPVTRAVGAKSADELRELVGR